MRGFIFGVILTVAVLIGGVYFALATGKFPVGADNPPGKMERSLANMALDEYVDRNAPHLQNPIQPTPENLTQGAREYEEHCAFCHGGAAERVSVMRTKFNPPVPQIINRIPGDPDANLWWVTKHGIRMTGMPSWDKVLTDDEIWKIITFIKYSNKLPPEAQSAWQEAASGGHKANEADHEQGDHTQHMHPPAEIKR
jgi:thiosulfate dehydrogenase